MVQFPRYEPTRSLRACRTQPTATIDQPYHQTKTALAFFGQLSAIKRDFIGLPSTEETDTNERVCERRADFHRSSPTRDRPKLVASQ